MLQLSAACARERRQAIEDSITAGTTSHIELHIKIERFSTLRVAKRMATGVLIVEDEFLLRLDAADFFGDAGFKVYEVSNADEAIALLELFE